MSTRFHRSKQPRFPIGIQDRTYSAVIEKLDLLNYDGPVALSCDDTKLLASLRPYYDHDRAGYYLMGHVGEPFHLPDPDSFCTVVNEHGVQRATKVSYCAGFETATSDRFRFASISFVYGVCKSPFPEFLPLLLPLSVFLRIWTLQSFFSICGNS